MNKRGYSHYRPDPDVQELDSELGQSKIRTTFINECLRALRDGQRIINIQGKTIEMKVKK